MPHFDDFTISLTDSPDPDDNQFIDLMIKQFNNVISPHHLASRQEGAVTPLAIFIHDTTDNIVGGLIADTYWEWLAIDDFWIHEDLRGKGYGTRLLKMAETEAKRRGCKWAHLKTFGFQARTFYERFGYRVIGVLENYPPGSAFYWMRKDFGPES
jgi:GNAT superfamily N-acetyltransferase